MSKFYDVVKEYLKGYADYNYIHCFIKKLRYLLKLNKINCSTGDKILSIEYLKKLSNIFFI